MHKFIFILYSTVKRIFQNIVQYSLIVAEITLSLLILLVCTFLQDSANSYYENIFNNSLSYSYQSSVHLLDTSQKSRSFTYRDFVALKKEVVELEGNSTFIYSWYLNYLDSDYNMQTIELFLVEDNFLTIISAGSLGNLDLSQVLMGQMALNNIRNQNLSLGDSNDFFQYVSINNTIQLFDSVIDIDEVEILPDETIELISRIYNQVNLKNAILLPLSKYYSAFEKREENLRQFSGLMVIQPPEGYLQSITLNKIQSFFSQDAYPEYEMSIYQPIMSFKREYDEIKVYTAALKIFSIFSLVVILVFLVNLVISIVLDRRKELSIKICLGATRSNVFMEMLIEILILISLGSIFSTVLAVLVTGAINNSDLFSYDLTLSILTTVGINAALIGTLILGLLIPFQRIKNINPLETIKSL
jgi:ABC-type antimicrobial peptide transport system permease subunit